MINTISTYLKYANLQIAAEALYGFDPKAPIEPLTPGGTQAYSTIRPEFLTKGNNRSSRFTEAQAAQFITDGWTVVEHKSNTATGFSGTLFKNTATNELVISFRSTEFIDDAARDNQATNTMELKPYGWAFGQIDDMEQWYSSLKINGKISSGQNFAVTGYSLGGHLATAFHLLRKEQGEEPRITGTYTFNGAGVGEVNLSQALDLSTVITGFQRMRRDGNADYFADPASSTLYNSVKSSLLAAPQLNLALVDAQIAAVGQAYRQAIFSGGPVVEYTTLREALVRVRDVVFENQRVAGLTPAENPALGKPSTPPNTLTALAAADLDYQIAVLRASAATTAFRSDVVLGASQAFPGGRNTLTGLNRIYDVYGSTFRGDDFSAVSNSQHHYGVETPIFIEDQPLYRGSYVTETAAASFIANGVKLLAPEFDRNDFGDGHSLVLAIDSLSLMNLFYKLDTNFTQSTAAAVFRTASNLKGISAFRQQGYAEGDTLENVLQSLGDLVGASSLSGWAKMNPQTAGGTWAETSPSGENSEGRYTGRAVFQDNIALVAKKIEDQSLGGKFTVIALPVGQDAAITANAATAAAAIDLRYALKNLNAFTLTGDDVLYKPFNKNGELDIYDPAKGTGDLTAEWLADRARFLSAKIQMNSQNKFYADAAGDTNLLFRDADIAGKPFEIDAFTTAQGIGVGSTVAIQQSALVFDTVEKIRADIRETIIQSDHQKILFGSDKSDALTGANLTDRLYGGASTDYLQGNGGDDYLEGGTGTDVYQYGADNGTLGLNADAVNDGNDTIRDTDGKGIVRYSFTDNSFTGPTARSTQSGLIAGLFVKDQGASTWNSLDNQFSVSQSAGSAAGRVHLAITFYNVDSSGTRGTQRPGTITIKDWQDGGLNIRLTDGTLAASPVTTRNINGDLDPQRDANGNLTGAKDDIGNLNVSAIASPNRADVLNGSSASDHITASGGDDTINPLRTDTLNLGGLTLAQAQQAIRDHWASTTAADWIEGGAGRDLIQAGSGNDLIEGGGGNTSGSNIGGDRIVAGAGDDRVFANIKLTTQAAIAQGETDTASNIKGAFINGLAGDDLVVGHTGADALSGGAGKDTLIGGAGDDNLWGDSNLQGFTNDEWSITRRVTSQNELNSYDFTFNAATGLQAEANGAADVIYGGGGAGADILIGDDRNGSGAATSLRSGCGMRGQWHQRTVRSKNTICHRHGIGYRSQSTRSGWLECTPTKGFMAVAI